MAFQISLFQIIFEQYLKISPDLISKYATIQDQLLYLVLIPHVILFLFLFGFGLMLIKEHRGLRLLLLIASYIFIIWGGWYGSFFIPLTIGWFYIMLIFGFFLFFISKILHPFTAKNIGAQVAKPLFDSVGYHLIGKEKEREALEEEIKMVIDQIRTLEADLRNPGITPMAKSYAQMQIQQLKNQLVVLKRKLSKL